MTKRKLIFGTYNTVTPGSAYEQLEKMYQTSYKPFLKLLYEYPKVKASIHYSGILFNWLEEHHSELFIIINEMIKRRQIELLGGGFYDPVLSVIPGKDRLNQIEMLTTYIRKKFGRRPRGFWLTEQVWEPHICSSIKSSGMNYVFLDEYQFNHAGLYGKDVYRPCYTEDQGKILSVLPVHTSLVLSSRKQRVENFIDTIRILKIPEDGIISLLFDGSLINSDQNISWFKQLFDHLTVDKSKLFTFERSGDYVKSLGTLNKVYFPVSSGSNIEFWAMSTSKQREWIKHNKKFTAKNGLFCSPTGYFRQFFSKYRESNLLYARMLYTHDLVSQIRNDKSRKKSASEEILKSQNNYPYWHGVNPGIYDRAARQYAYRCLINAEKNIREKGVFTTHLQALDFDMDGGDEYIYHGQYINAYIHQEGARIFELDYMIASWNYTNTMKRYPESYHTDDDIRFFNDKTVQGAFIDHFIAESLSKDSFSRNDYKELGDFLSGNYTLHSIDKEHKELILARNGKVNREDVTIEKKFKFRKNLIEISYKITYKGKGSFTTTMATEVDLSLSSPEEKNMLVQTGQDTLSDLFITDLKNKVLITLQSSKPYKLWSFPVYTHTKSNNGTEKRYQYSSFVFRWDISLETDQVWENTCTIKLEKK